MIQNCVQQLQPYLRVRALCSYLDKEVGASHNLGLVGLGLVAAELPAYLLLQGSTDLQRRGIRALAVPRKGIRALAVTKNQGISCAQKSIGKYWTIINII